jgi:hypothetical protein
MMKKARVDSPTLREHIDISFNLYQGTLAIGGIFLGFVMMMLLQVLSQVPLAQSQSQAKPTSTVVSPPRISKTDVTHGPVASPTPPAPTSAVGTESLASDAPDNSVATPLTPISAWLVRSLVFALLLFTFAITAFHVTADRSVRYWIVFYPGSRWRVCGTVCFSAGLATMLLAAGVMLFTTGFLALSIAVWFFAACYYTHAFCCLFDISFLWFEITHPMTAPYVRNVDKYHNYEDDDDEYEATERRGAADSGKIDIDSALTPETANIAGATTVREP